MTFPTFSTQIVVEGHEHVYHYEAAEDVLQGQVVELDSDNAGRTVEPVSSVAPPEQYGVALYDQSSGAQVAVAGPGAVVRVVSDTGSISSGKWVTATNNTNEGELTGASSGQPVLGQALQDDTGSNEEATLIMHVNPSPNGSSSI